MAGRLGVRANAGELVAEPDSGLARVLPAHGRKKHSTDGARWQREGREGRRGMGQRAEMGRGREKAGPTRSLGRGRKREKKKKRWAGWAEKDREKGKGFLFLKMIQTHSI